MASYISSLAVYRGLQTVGWVFIISIIKTKRVLRKKTKYILRNWITASNLVDFIVSKALKNHPLDHPRHFFTVQSYLPQITSIPRFSLMLTVWISLYLTIDR